MVERAGTREARRIERGEARMSQQQVRVSYEGLTKVELPDQLASVACPRRAAIRTLIERLVSADRE